MKNTSRIVILVTLILISATRLSADHSHDYARASEAYNAGDYQTAFHLWSEEAQGGDPGAQEMLAAMYAAGKGTSQNYGEAVKWYRMASAQGSSSAQYTLGRMYYEGLGVKKKLEYAYAYWLVAASSGNASAKVRLRQTLEEITPEQIAEAKDITFELLRELAN